MALHTPRVLGVGLLLILSGATSDAQELAGSFEQLRVLVKPGDTVRVTDSRGQELRGRLTDLTSSALTLQVSGDRRTLLEGDVTAVHQRRNDSLADGAKWGFAIGAGLGVLGGITIVREYDDGSAALIPILGLIYGSIGAGAGAGIDAMSPSEQPIYARRRASSKVTLRPLLTANRKGVLASLTFGGS
jgi:hypothetical protein